MALACRWMWWAAAGWRWHRPRWGPIWQLRWAAGHVASTFLPEGDAQTKIWDLTGFPEWVCLDKVGPNAYAPVSRGALLSGGVGGPSTGLPMPPPPGAGPLDELDEEAQLQLALAASLLTR